jgi:hypothetical protein
LCTALIGSAVAATELLLVASTVLSVPPPTTRARMSIARAVWAGESATTDSASLVAGPIFACLPAGRIQLCVFIETIP